MNKLWIIGPMVLTSFWSQQSMASVSETGGAKVEENNTFIPRNPFSGVQGATYTSPEIIPIPEVKLLLVEEVLLSQQLTSWAQQNGYKLLWNSSKDFMIYQSISLHGKTKEEILIQLGQIFTSENYGLVLKNYQNNNVLIIDEQ